MSSDNHHPIRELLRGLKKVPAAPDFEARLQRRLSGGEPHPSSDRARWFQPRRVPAFAYSLLAVAVIGFIAYYLYWPEMQYRNQISDQIAVQGRNIPPQPPPLQVLRPAPEGEPETKKKRMAGTADKVGKPEPRADKGTSQAQSADRAGEAINKPAPMRSMAAPSAGVNALMKQTMSVIPSDSLKIADSLRIDSIMKARKADSLRQQGAQRRKPG